MAAITEIPNTKWRDKLTPAYFRGEQGMFHVDTSSRDSGRRIVTYEFPKKDFPYSEDMGRRAIAFTVRGYIIAYPRDVFGGARGPLQKRDYRIARDSLQAALEIEGAGVLKLPTQAPLTVVCTRYRMSEDEKLGGYCTFDMSFVELGVQPFRETIDSRTQLIQQAENLRKSASSALTLPDPSESATTAAP